MFRPVSRKSAFRIVLIALWLLPAAYFAVHQISEERSVTRYLDEKGLAGIPVTKEDAIKLADSVRADFNTKEESFDFLDMADRPFLRATTAQLLEYREGLCGDTSRVIISLLLKAGFDATRVTLFDRYLRATHTLVSVKIGDREFFLDSTGSGEGVRELTSQRDINGDSFGLSHYSGDITQRREFRARDVPLEEQFFFERFMLYSYEALPMTKILTLFGTDVRVINLKRPPKLISALAEKPNLLKAVLWFTLSGLLVTFLELFMRWQRKGWGV